MAMAGERQTFRSSLKAMSHDGSCRFDVMMSPFFEAGSGGVYKLALDIVSSRLSDAHQLGDEYHAVVMRDRLIDHTTDQSQLPEHGSRNRYVNVLPYDYNRVKISTTPGLCAVARPGPIILNHDPLTSLRLRQCLPCLLLGRA